MKRFFVRVKKCIPIYDYPVAEKTSNYQPFFIIGSGRSGNTLLRRILQANPTIHIPPETYVLSNVINTFRNNAGIFWGDLVSLLLSKFMLHPEFETLNLDFRPLYEKLYNTPKNKRSLCYIIDQIYKYHALTVAQKETIRWGDKTPLNTMHLEDISKTFPAAQYVHIIRDGCDVIASYLKSGIYTELEGAANRWRKSIENVNKLKSLYPTQVYEIKYEDLVSNTSEIVKNVCSFLNIKYTDDMLSSEQDASKMGDVAAHKHHNNVGKAISTDSIGKGRRELSEQQLHQLNILIGTNMKELNYPPCI